MTTYDEYRGRQRLVGRYRQKIRRYGTLGDPKEAMIEASQEVFGDFGDPGLEHCYAGVYFVASGPYIKIGEAGGGPYERMRSFHTGNPHGLKVLHVIAEDRKKERKQLEDQLHERFAYLRLPGSEWFHPGPELTEFIAFSCARECYPSPT
ncbi:GIY-YIG nuclease family protein [Micromonospora echinaurantiaca]|uniref:GIY-YIG nuclease family protein n=1 Tax=Micromonospora echinaurantiaca TaxID=47857 RepID=UPI0037201369